MTDGDGQQSVGARLAALVDRFWEGVRRLRVVSLVALLVALVLVVTVWSIGGDSGDASREGSEVIGDGGSLADPPDAVSTYRIVYRIENRAGGEEVLRTEQWTIRRPFDGRVEERAGEPPGDDPPTITTTRFGALGVRSPTAQPVALQVPPAPPVADVQPLAALDRMVDEGFADIRERRRIVGLDRECQVYRLGGPIGGGALTPLGSVEGEHADVCVDAQGFVLEEVWFVDGGDRILRRRLAVTLELDPEVSSGTFAGPDVDPPPPDQGGGSLLEVESDSRPPTDVFFELRTVPSGFRHRGRYAVIPPQAEAFGDPLASGQKRAGVVDVYVDGARFVSIDQGGTLGQVDAFEPHPHAVEVEAGELGTAELILGLRFSEIRSRRDAGRYVRISGPVDPDVLLAFARALQPGAGGELAYIDRPG